MSDKPIGYEHGEPQRKIDAARAAVAAGTITEDAAIDELFAWAQRVGWGSTREGIRANVQGRGGKRHE
jgi:hypothetical protein